MHSNSLVTTCEHTPAKYVIAQLAKHYRGAHSRARASGRLTLQVFLEADSILIPIRAWSSRIKVHVFEPNFVATDRIDKKKCLDK